MFVRKILFAVVFLMMLDGFLFHTTGKKNVEVKQWVKKVVSVSSEYNKGTWAAKKVEGAPDVYPNYGDLHNTWAQKKCDSKQWIVLEYDRPVFVTDIYLYLTFHAGAIKKIALYTPRNTLETVYEVAKVVDIKRSMIRHVKVKPLFYKVNKIKIYVDCSAAKTWCELDAVQLVGQSSIEGLDTSGFFKQWVEKVIRFSSQYNTGTWAAKKIEGAPNVYPNYGDLKGTWAQKICDAKQWIMLKYAVPVYVTGINAYQTYNAGAIKRISVITPQNKLKTVYEVPKVVNIKKSQILRVRVKPLSYRVNKIKIEVDCTAAKTWCELDAVEMVGRINAKAVAKGKWTAWETWNGCTKTCGGGIQQRFRECDYPDTCGSRRIKCDGDSAEARICEVKPCPKKRTCSNVKCLASDHNIDTPCVLPHKKHPVSMRVLNKNVGGQKCEDDSGEYGVLGDELWVDGCSGIFELCFEE